MNSATAFRFLILLIPAALVIFRLFPAEHPRYGNLKAVALETQQHQSRQVGQDRIVESSEREKDTFDKFLSHELWWKTHYQSHDTTSGYDYNHYRPAYKYGFDLPL